MKVKELIMRLLDEPMDAEIKLCTDYDKRKVEYYDDLKVVTSGVVFGIDEVKHSAKDLVYINFTDWREDE